MLIICLGKEHYILVGVSDPPLISDPLGGCAKSKANCGRATSKYVLSYILFCRLTIVLLFSPLPLSQVAKDVISEFAADGVKYLELRSTPREEKNTGKHLNYLFCRF